MRDATFYPAHRTTRPMTVEPVCAPFEPKKHVDGALLERRHLLPHYERMKIRWDKTCTNPILPIAIRTRPDNRVTVAIINDVTQVSQLEFDLGAAIEALI